MYLHKERETFREIIEQTANYNGRTPEVVEKDYYVTLILKLLAEQLELCVFKGGTSLSKGFHVIDRFSEDIDITFKEHIGESRRKKLKNVVLKGISEELEMPIDNWNETQSDRDYNAYLFSYTSVFAFDDERLPQYIKLETALGSYAFPTQTAVIHNYIGDYLEGAEKEEKENSDVRNSLRGDCAGDLSGCGVQQPHGNRGNVRNGERNDCDRDRNGSGI